jgi:hypothetical protein
MPFMEARSSALMARSAEVGEVTEDSGGSVWEVETAGDPPAAGSLVVDIGEGLVLVRIAQHLVVVGFAVAYLDAGDVA